MTTETLVSDATTTRNATLRNFIDILKAEHALKLDIVAPVGQFRSQGGNLLVKGAESIITLDGVSNADGEYRPTNVFDEGLADKLRIPSAYLRRMRAQAPDLFDANVNGWLHGRTRVVNGVRNVTREADGRQFMLRLLRAADGGTGVARAILSDRFARMENLDILLAALDGIRDSGIRAEVTGADLTDRRMFVRVTAPDVAVHADALLRNYRSPFTGDQGSDNPIVFAGFEIQNSEVGGGAFRITPRIVVRVCKNGMTITKDVLKSVHLGGQLEAGPIQWSGDTHRKAEQLVTAKTRDAVRTFLNPEYVQGVINGMTEAAQVTVTKPTDTIQELSKTLRFDEDTTNGILEHFLTAGDRSAGGVMHAITSHAQTVTDAQKASDLEAIAVQAMHMVAAA